MSQSSPSSPRSQRNGDGNEGTALLLLRANRSMDRIGRSIRRFEALQVEHVRCGGVATSIW